MDAGFLVGLLVGWLFGWLVGWLFGLDLGLCPTSTSWAFQCQGHWEVQG